MDDLFDGERERPARAAAVKKLPQKRLMGFSPRELLLGVVLVVALGWGAWVTKSLIAEPRDQEFVQLQLQGIISEYLQAQARSETDQNVAAQQTAIFMGKLDETVAALSKQGKIVLVHEAVIGGDIPDVTDQVRKVVYAQVAMPKMGAAPGVQGEMEAYLAANGEGNVPAR